ncbi:hypothetical protein AN958_07370 [Leucoagaricus sp. SymC.cos]|nr:hypothetical protein AN958_07370 [Leucoagaricus sp. SymC.cos]
MTLLRLPTELMESIMLSLDIQSILSCQRICKAFRCLYQESARLQYRVECEFAGVCDNPACNLPVKMRLRMLRDRELAWSSLQPVFTHRAFFPPDMDVDRVDITGGHYYVGMTDPTPNTLSWVRSCPIPLEHVQAIATAGVEGQWSKIVIEGCVDFATCIDEHDLIAFLTIHPTDNEDTYQLRISLKQHSTHLPYPSVKNSIFPVGDTTCDPESLLARMEICGDVLVLAIAAEEALFFFDWRTGRMTSLVPLSGVCNMTFIRHDILCLAMPDTVTLAIYYVPSSKTSSVRLIQSFTISETFFPSGCTWIEARGCPSPTGDGLFPTHVPTSQPFLENPEEAIIVFDFHWRDTKSPTSMIVHRRSLLGLLPPQNDWLACDTRVVPWSEWGPQHTRWLDSSGNDECFTTISNGQRYVHFLSKNSPTTYTVVDFNRYRVHKALEEPRSPVNEPDEEDLQDRGKLPCIGTRSTEKVSYNMVFASDTGLVGLDVRFFFCLQ